MTDNEQDPIDKAGEFARTISESPEYRSFIRASERLKSDTVALNLMNVFRRKRAMLYGGQFSPGLMDELKELQDNINSNAAIREYTAAQAGLVDILRRANDLITARIGMQFAYSSGDGCCG